MDKSKGKKKSTIINKSFTNKLGGKNSNYTGEIFYGEESENRNNYRKWILTIQTPGIYTIKNVQTELFLTSDDRGDFFTCPEDLGSSYQKWGVITTNESYYVLQNVHSQMVLCCTKINFPMMIKLQDPFYEDCPDYLLLDLFTIKPKK